MYYLYILKSRTYKTGYIGVTHKVEKRVGEHNKGRVKSTKAKRPWIVVHTEEFQTLSEAKKREWFFKYNSQGGKLKRKILETAGIPAQSA